MKRIILTLIFTSVLMSLESCCKQPVPTGFADDTMWCIKPSKATEKADVFFVVSTNIMHSYKPDGSETFIAVLNDKEKASLATEINYIHDYLFPEKVNFFAPYYHQVTMASLSDSTLTNEQRLAFAAQAEEEVLEAFNYYMKNLNQGRPFILAGYSQGAIQIRNILSNLTKEQLSRMVVAYMMGYGIRKEQMENPNFKMATGATDTGVAVSFTSLAKLEAVYPLINTSGACINPVNWRTDSTPADFEFDGETLTAHINEENHVILVDGFHYDKHPTKEWGVQPWSKDNYHNFEIYFYAPHIRQNALDRIDAMLNAK